MLSMLVRMLGHLLFRCDRTAERLSEVVEHERQMIHQLLVGQLRRGGDCRITADSIHPAPRDLLPMRAEKLG